MINNDILNRVSTIFQLNAPQIQAIFALSEFNITAEQLENIFKEKDDPDYVELLDVELASFLNGLIVEKRGKKDGVQHEAEQVLSNNLIFNKIKIALTLKAEDVMSVLESVGVTLTKYELSALFRNSSNKHYRPCSDDVLSAFLKGLKLQHQG